MPIDKTASGPFDVRHIRQLAEILNETGLTEIEVDRGGLRIRVARAPAPTMAMWSPPGPVAAAPDSAAESAAAPRTMGEVVSSPMVGTVYFQSQPGAEPFVRVGDTVAEGQTLLLVEAMKTMNPIAAPRAGRIVEFLVNDGQPVEYGEALLVIG